MPFDVDDRTRRLAPAAALAVVLACAGCSREGEGTLFTAETAQDVAQAFHKALVSGDPAAIAALARVPFRYKDRGRTWPDEAALKANLAKELPRFQHLLSGLDRVEVFSRADLLAGKWPRGRDVPEGRRVAEVDALGIEPYGWLARIHSDGRPGYLLVLNPAGPDRLAVQMLDV
jgi:hypothetical protein